MYYIFNSSGKCMATIDNKPNMADIASRNETLIECNENYDISKIQLVGGVITEITEEIGE